MAKLVNFVAKMATLRGEKTEKWNGIHTIFMRGGEEFNF